MGLDGIRRPNACQVLLGSTTACRTGPKPSSLDPKPNTTQQELEGTARTVEIQKCSEMKSHYNILGTRTSAVTPAKEKEHAGASSPANGPVATLRYMRLVAVLAIKAFHTVSDSVTPPRRRR